MYTIKWRNKETDETGSGLFLHDQAIAQKICDISNANDPCHERWVEEGEP